MLIAHLSDFHLLATPALETPIRPNICSVISALVTDLKEFSPAIDAVVLSGDLTNNGKKEEYALLRELLLPLKAKIIATVGNHDERGNFRRAFADLLPDLSVDAGERIQYELVVKETRFLVLDTVIPGDLNGALPSASLVWLEKKLAIPFDGQTTIVMHHPPHTSGIGFFDRIGLHEGKQALGEIVARYSGALNILCGHIHRPSQALWNGAFIGIAGSPAFEMGLDLNAHDREPPFVDVPYAYFIYRTEKNGFSIHPRAVSLPA